MDQWIVVEFPEGRSVLVDGTICGKTNKPFQVQLGTHTITLSDPQNYTPGEITQLIFNTTEANPMKFVFTLL